jgi:hypothetical protein
VKTGLLAATALLVALQHPALSAAQDAGRLGAARDSSYARARAVPEFQQAIASRGDSTPEELADRISNALTAGTADLAFWRALAFRETLDCAGACVALVPYSTSVNVVEIHLRGDEWASLTSVTLRLTTPLGRDRLERHFGSSADSGCRSAAADSSEVECPFDRSRSGPQGIVTVWRTAQPVGDTFATDLSLHLAPSRATARPGPQPLPPVTPTVDPSSRGLPGALAGILLALAAVSVATRQARQRRGLSFSADVLPRVARAVAGCAVAGGVGAVVSYFFVHHLSGESLAGAVLPIVISISGAGVGLLASVILIPLLSFARRAVASAVTALAVVAACLQLELLILLHWVR